VHVSKRQSSDAPSEKQQAQSKQRGTSKRQVNDP